MEDVEGENEHESLGYISQHVQRSAES